MRTIEPLSFWLNDEREAKFILDFARIRQATAGTKAEANTANAASFGIELIARTLYLGMLDKGDLTFEEFESLLPPDPELLQGFYEALKDHCGMKQNEKYRPRKSQA
jgi:hypothetical protein